MSEWKEQGFKQAEAGLGQNEIVLEHWQIQSQSLQGRLNLAFLRGHTLIAPLLFHGLQGFTRAQTTMLLFNTAALEIVILSSQFSAPADGPVVINSGILISSAFLAAVIAIPGGACDRSPAPHDSPTALTLPTRW